MCRLRGPCPVVVFDELPGHTPNVSGVEEDEMVEGILTQRPMKSLDVRIRIRPDQPNALASDHRAVVVHIVVP